MSLPAFGNRFAEIRHRIALVFELGRLQIKRRYIRNVLGILWSAAYPIAQLAALMLVFTQIFATPVERYLVFLIAGLLPWNFLAAAFNAGAQSLVLRRDVLESSTLPTSVVVLGDLVAELMIFIMYFVPIAIGVVVFSGRPLVLLLALPIVVLPLLMVAFSGGLMLAHLTPRLRDLSYIVAIGMSLMFWFLPIAYHRSQTPPWLARILDYNPFVVLIEPIQTVIHGAALPSAGLMALSFTVALAAVLTTTLVYRQLKRTTILYI